MIAALFRSAAIPLLLWFAFFLPAPGPAEAGARKQDQALQEIDLALEGAKENGKSGERLVAQILDEIERTRKMLVGVGTVAIAKSGSKSLAAMPDVCKTPSAPAPVPLPYPDVAESSDTAKSAKKVQVGGRAVAIQRTDYTERAAGDEAGSKALLDHLRSVRSEVEARYDFVAGICKKCKLAKKDKQALLQWLAATKKELRALPAGFDDYVRRIERARSEHLKR